MMKISDRPEKMNRRTTRRREERRSACCCTSPRSSNRARTQSPLSRRSVERADQLLYYYLLLMPAALCQRETVARMKGDLSAKKWRKEVAASNWQKKEKWEYTQIDIHDIVSLDVLFNFAATSFSSCTRNDSIQKRIRRIYVSSLSSLRFHYIYTLDQPRCSSLIREKFNY